jgi:hypothetical protein
VATRLLSRVAFASLLSYSPRGTSEQDRRSRSVRDNVKHDRASVIALAAARIKERWGSLGIEEFLGPDALLVPAPRSAPLKSPDALWPGLRICQELVEAKLGVDIMICLERHTAVPKAAFAGHGQRTKAQGHFDTVHVLPQLFVPTQRVITIVDDFVTSGAMLLAMASHVSHAFPSSEIRCFGRVRTMESVSDILSPSTGIITLVANTGETRRRP